MINEHLNGYALALFSLAQEEEKLNKIKSDSISILDAIKDGNERITHILSSKALSTIDVQEITNEAFKGIDQNIINFINIVSSKSIATIIIPTLKKLISLINDDLGIKEGVVYTTIKLSEKQIDGMVQKAEKILGFKPSLKNKLDPDLISGFKIVVGDKVIEDSVISRIHNIKYALLRGGN